MTFLYRKALEAFKKDAERQSQDTFKPSKSKRKKLNKHL